MSEELVEEEVLEITPEEAYDAEYEKAWEDEGEELEQPNEETETTDEIVEEEVEEDSNDEEIVAEDKPVEEVTEDNLDDKPSDDFAEVLKWNKQEIPVTRDELISLAQKGFDSDKKWREASVDRPFSDLIKSSGLSIEEFTTMIDARGGNAEALASIAKQANIDMYDAEVKDYKPQVEAKNYELDDVIAEINQDEDIATQMNDYVSSVPQGIKDVLTSKPEILRGLNADMKNGIAQKVMPEVIKQLAINPNQDFIRLYQGVGQAVFSKEETKEVEKPTRVEATREEKKRVAVSKHNTAPKKSTTDDYDSAWNDDKHFNDVLARMSCF